MSCPAPPRSGYGRHGTRQPRGPEGPCAQSVRHVVSPVYVPRSSPRLPRSFLVYCPHGISHPPPRATGQSTESAAIVPFRATALPKARRFITRGIRMTTDPVDLTAALVRCPSVTPEEGGALQLLEQLLGAAGFDCTRVDRNGTPNLFARWGQRNARKVLGFNGHTDVVPVGDPADWTHPPFAAHREDGWLYGRGATDMKIRCRGLCRGSHRPRGRGPSRGRHRHHDHRRRGRPGSRRDDRHPRLDGGERENAWTPASWASRRPARKSGT